MFKKIYYNLLYLLGTLFTPYKRIHALERQLEDTYSLSSTGFRADGSELFIDAKGETARIFVGALVDLFYKSGSENFLSMEMAMNFKDPWWQSKKRQPRRFNIVIQAIGNNEISPAQKLTEYKNRIQELEDQNALLKRQVTEPVVHGILSELDTLDAQPEGEIMFPSAPELLETKDVTTLYMRECLQAESQGLYYPPYPNGFTDTDNHTVLTPEFTPDEQRSDQFVLRSVYYFPNNYGASVVSGVGTYGGFDALEVGILRAYFEHETKEITYQLIDEKESLAIGFTEDPVYGHLTREEAIELLTRISQLDTVDPIDEAGNMRYSDFGEPESDTEVSYSKPILERGNASS